MGGSKVFAQKAPSSGVAYGCDIKRRSNGNAADFGGLNPGRLTVVGGAAAMFARPGFEPPSKRSAVSCITIRPRITIWSLLAWSLPTAWDCVCQ